MARSHIAVALTAACLSLLATLSLIHNFGSIKHLSDHPFRFFQGQLHSKQNVQYLLGVGKADITGPVVEINFMGYADPNQVGSGLRQRLYARTFIIGSTETPEDRIVYVVQDTQSGDTAVRQGVLDGLREMGRDYAMYGQQNVAITGTHSHSGPGAWLNYLLPQITSKGFDRQSYDAVVKGTLLSIRRAHENLQLGTLTYRTTTVPNASVNRSPFAYNANSASERAQYDDNVDIEMSLLAFRSLRDDKDLGILTWFPVHGTSMLGNNTMVTGDNKGVAADMFERYARKLPNSSPDFVAGFSQSNVGDTSPNVLGAWCESGPQEGKSCDFETSLCAGKTQPCHGRGPHYGLQDSGTASTFEIGRRQYVAARLLFERLQKGSSTITPSGLAERSSLEGSTVKSLHVFVDMSSKRFVLPNGTEVKTCPAALGYSFAAGTTDGPGAFDFKQHNSGDPNANPLWETVRNQLHEPGPAQIACHGVKPILLDVGETERPYLWTPNVVDMQFFRVGNLFIIVSPGEATTMAGRRWKSALKDAVIALGDTTLSRPLVVLGGPSNSYTHYIATEEEYAIQRYEGASTLYGPHTLAAYMDSTRGLIPYLAQTAVADKHGSKPPTVPALPDLDAGPSPPVHTNTSLSFINPIVRDSSGLFKTFGEVIKDAESSYYLQHDHPVAIEVSFQAANPRNDVRLEGTFVAVERFSEHTGVWYSVRDDSDWSVVFGWERTSTLLGTSIVTVRWELGRYRIKYHGDAKSLGGDFEAFQGVTREFDLV
ncbi:Neutral/alkaline nonlysosomal ceramidase [Elsinoe ampelina]|uniref:Neutral ceramidase n=1 Tax=Elsinoe ampelina TaxID=302913 RepID=A0A6A6GEB7_9PEZI|nr:Neutral/alkaline nonlysosomal ceramidase [Elsinoe ampelina]